MGPVYVCESDVGVGNWVLCRCVCMYVHLLSISVSHITVYCLANLYRQFRVQVLP